MPAGAGHIGPLRCAKSSNQNLHYAPPVHTHLTESAIAAKFAQSGWELLAAPAEHWLQKGDNRAELLAAVEEADRQCGSCGCEFDPLYKRALELLK